MCSSNFRIAFISHACSLCQFNFHKKKKYSVHKKRKRIFLLIQPSYTISSSNTPLTSFLILFPHSLMPYYRWGSLTYIYNHPLITVYFLFFYSQLCLACQPFFCSFSVTHSLCLLFFSNSHDIHFCVLEKKKH